MKAIPTPATIKAWYSCLADSVSGPGKKRRRAIDTFSYLCFVHDWLSWQVNERKSASQHFALLLNNLKMLGFSVAGQVHFPAVWPVASTQELLPLTEIGSMVHDRPIQPVRCVMVQKSEELDFRWDRQGLWGQLWSWPEHQNALLPHCWGWV